MQLFLSIVTWHVQDAQDTETSKKEGKSLGKFLNLQYIFTSRDSYFSSFFIFFILCK